MRRNFAEILASAKIDYKLEYAKFYDLLFEDSVPQKRGHISVHDVFEECFYRFWFRGTCLTLQEFDEQNGFVFAVPEDVDNIDDLLLIMEYLYNLVGAYRAVARFDSVLNVDLFIEQIHKVAEELGYKFKSSKGLTILVEKDNVATAVAESDLIPEDVSYKVISYNHHSMKGNLEEKKDVILKLANLLEGKRSVLHEANSTLEKDLFFCFNNLNIRHNNIDLSDQNKFKPTVADMEKTELEKWYDEVFQMCLLAFMEIEHAERKPKIDELKKEIEQTTKE